VPGSRYPREIAGRLLQRVRRMQDSLTYQAVLDEGRSEGRLEEARHLLRELGERRFGPADATIIAGIERLTEVEHAERATFRLLDGGSIHDGPRDAACPGPSRRP
jgi:hypothetical protein